MMKRWKLCGLILPLFCLTACGGRAALREQTALPDNMVHLYVTQGNDIVQAADDYQLKTPDTITTCVEDIMTAEIALDGSCMDSYSYMMGEDNSLQMDITMKDGTYEQEDIMLLMASVTKTLFQMQDISSIDLTVQSMDNTALAQQLFLRDTIYYYDSADSGLKEYAISMYVPNEAGTALETYGIKVQSDPQISDQEWIVQELVRKNVLPANTKVNQVSVHGDICYLDLSSEFESGTGTLSPELMIDALVNSVITQTDAEMVQILIDGKINPTYRNAVAIDKPLSFNAEVLEQTEK